MSEKRNRTEALLLRLDESYWQKPGESPHEAYRRRRTYNKLLRKAIARKLVEP